MIYNKPSEDILVACPNIVKDGKYTTFGEVWTKLNEVTDLYILCANKLQANIDFHRKQNGN